MTCNNCNTKLIKKKKEHKSNFAKRKFCSLTCASDYRRKHNIGMGGIMDSTFRERYGWSRYDY
jgi:hypothetical protein